MMRKRHVSKTERYTGVVELFGAQNSCAFVCVWLPLIQLLCRFRCSDCEHFLHCNTHTYTGIRTLKHSPTHTSYHQASTSLVQDKHRHGTLSTFRWPLMHSARTTLQFPPRLSLFLFNEFTHIHQGRVSNMS